MFYWKDSLSDGSTTLKWLKAIDRPVPQVSLRLNVYEINDNDFTELGVDYISWKNGPGADLLGFGYDWTNFTSVTDFSQWENVVNAVTKGPAHNFTGMTGFLVAPQFDATFLRMLTQKGKAKVATSGTLTVVNDYNSDPGSDNFDGAKYRIKFSPSYQNISKDDDRNIGIDTLGEEFYFYLRRPTIGFNEAATQAETVMFGWVMSVKDSVESTNDGANVENQHLMMSSLTLGAGTEKFLGTYTKDHHVKQDNGIPFLNDIPGLKYLFGSTANSKTKTRVFVTVKASPVVPGTNLSEWAGKVVSAAEMVKDDLKAMDK
jgi:type II secretory pathway component GspD/PulD (secretin)